MNTSTLYPYQTQKLIKIYELATDVTKYCLSKELVSSSQKVQFGYFPLVYICHSYGGVAVVSWLNNLTLVVEQCNFFVKHLVGLTVDQDFDSSTLLDIHHPAYHGF